MKKLLIFLLVIPYYCLTQVNDTSVVFARWIEIKPDSVNSELFTNSSNNQENSDLIQLIKKLVVSNELNMYHEKINDRGFLEWQYIDFQEEFKNSMEYTKDSLKITPFFNRYGEKNDIPLTDEYGDPLIYKSYDGLEYYVYPEREVLDLYIKDLCAIKVKEVRSLNKETNTYEFLPSDIAFCMNLKDTKIQKCQELFWINISELETAFKNKNIVNSTFDKLLKAQYKGFQYKQTSIEDKELNYLELKHPKVIYLSDDCNYILPLFNLNWNEIIVLKLNDACSSTTLSYNMSDYSISIRMNSDFKFEKSLNFIRESNSQVAFVELTELNKGKYNLMMTGCVQKRPFTLIIE